MFKINLTVTVVNGGVSGMTERGGDENQTLFHICFRNRKTKRLGVSGKTFELLPEAEGLAQIKCLPRHQGIVVLIVPQKHTLVLPIALYTCN